MSTAVITIVDQPNEPLSVRVNFGKGGVCDESGAHRLAVEMLTQAVEANEIDRPLPLFNLAEDET